LLATLEIYTADDLGCYGVLTERLLGILLALEKLVSESPGFVQLILLLTIDMVLQHSQNLNFGQRRLLIIEIDEIVTSLSLKWALTLLDLVYGDRKELL
jgi:hypothetical protein